MKASGTTPLQPIVPDGRGGLHCCFDIARLDEFPFFLRVMGPNAGQAIGLQLDLNLQMIC